MSLPDQTPKLPKLPFLLADAILLGAAYYIINRTPGVLTVSAMAAGTFCVGLAAVLGAVPFLTDYARKQDEALDERQRGLEALSRTINTAAEQISIAANGLNELTDLTHKNLKQAEQLPHKLQDKIAEFNAQLDNAREDDREELEKEVVELRTSETERLQAISDKVHKAIGELGRIDSTAQQNLAARLEQAERAVTALAKAQAKALVDIDATFAARTATAVAAIQAALAHALTNLPDSVEPAEPADTATTSAAVEVASPPKRPRKARREEVAGGIHSPLSESPSPAQIEPAPSVPAPTQSPSPFFEPAPIPADAIVQIAPVAPVSAEPFPLAASPAPSPVSNGATAKPAIETPAIRPVLAGSDVAGAEPEDRPVRKRAPRKAAAELTGDLGFELSSEESPNLDDPAMTSEELAQQVISSDGATRLIATAYIGIGNRLFIRGEGPGLSWEKGVPLQFVSIGKWRWETADAAQPIAFKLYKNDDLECAGLGTLTLAPGHQQEVTAKF